jgi:predicted hydrocarbon binding protein
MNGQVLAALPVALLEATRSHDRPGEVLEDEDVSVSLPRRLGLSGVIETQIQRYETAVRAGRRIPLDEFINLLKLVLRRPDAEPILREAGARVAARHFEKSPGFYKAVVRTMPRAIGFVLLARSARNLLRNITGTDHVDVRSKPLVAQLHQSAVARIEPAGMSCALYGAAFEEIVSLYVGKKARMAHTRCEINGGSVCEWRVDV